MTDPAKLPSALLLAAALVLACGDAPPAAPAETAEVPAVSDAAPVTNGAPKIAADEPIFDFGAIGGTDPVEHVFKIRNVGDAELKVERVQKT
jgi:hypothetical protein